MSFSNLAQIAFVELKCDNLSKRLGVPPRRDYNLRWFGSLLASIYARILWRIWGRDAEAILRWHYGGDAEKAQLRLFYALKPIAPDLSDFYGVKAVRNGSKALEPIKSYVLQKYKQGDFSTIVKHGKVLSRTKRFARMLFLAKYNLKLLQNGFPLPPKREKPVYRRKTKRVLYLLHNSLPYDSGGYATRANGLMKGIQAQKYKISAVTRLGYPHDRGSKYHDLETPSATEIDGLTYFCINNIEVGMGKMPLAEYLHENIKALDHIVKEERPAIVHGASNFVNGVSANALGNMNGILSIYEVRGLWELTRLSREPNYENSESFKQYVRMETEACMNADHVFVLTNALKEEMHRRGIPLNHMTVIPNGVNSKRFVPLEKNEDLKQELGIGDQVVIGYVGSVVDYEGLDDLLMSLALLVERGVTNFKCLIVGDGAVWESLVAQCQELGLIEYVIFTGRVPHEVVEQYYSLIDIAPFPRKPLPVCEMVSPLKPFEAMAMGKCIVMSDVAALSEILIDGKTGRLFQKGSYQALADELENLLNSPEEIARLSENAIRWVRRERDWSVIATKITKVYDRLLKKHQKRLSKYTKPPARKSRRTSNKRTQK